MPAVPAERLSLSPASRPWWVWDLGVALATLCLLLAWDASGADLAVAQHVGGAQGFAWQHHWLTAQGLHQGGRLISLGLLLLVAAQVRWPLPCSSPLPRAERLWWLLATLACLLLIPFIKSRSLISCPWDLAAFGGVARQVPHWALQAWAGPGDGGPGRCFPSGHASGAFGFLTGWFVLRGRFPSAARRWLVGVCGLGLVFGAAQVARGAHFPSHVAWTAWICWVTAALAWHALQWWPHRNGLNGRAPTRA